MLQQFDEIPSGLLDCEAHELHRLLSGPSLIHLKGQRDPALFVSVLIHGNETTGWDAARELIRRHYLGPEAQRPRSLSLFIANTQAAAQGMRHLPMQPDYNRVWPGSELSPTPEHELMQTVLRSMRARGVFASVDVHNNTGLNPHYACVNNLKPSTLKLATLFSRTVLYFTRPLGVQAMAMSELCPSVTLECGKPQVGQGAEHALSYLETCINLNDVSTGPVSEHDIDLFHTTAVVKVPAAVSFGFHGGDLDLTLATGLEHYNFREMGTGTHFGTVRSTDSDVLSVTNVSGNDVFDEYFEIEQSALKTRKTVMPSMLTSNIGVVRQDCLCYLMERYALTTQRAPL